MVDERAVNIQGRGASGSQYETDIMYVSQTHQISTKSNTPCAGFQIPKH